MGRDFGHHLKSAHASLVSPAGVYSQAILPCHWRSPGHPIVAASYPGPTGLAILNNSLCKDLPFWESAVAAHIQGKSQGWGELQGSGKEKTQVKFKEKIFNLRRAGMWQRNWAFLVSLHPAPEKSTPRGEEAALWRQVWLHLSMSVVKTTQALGRRLHYMTFEVLPAAC